jgi:hypothetical protein
MSNAFDDMGRRSQAELADQVAQHTANKVKKEPENQERYRIWQQVFLIL